MVGDTALLLEVKNQDRKAWKLADDVEKKVTAIPQEFKKKRLEI
jgi:hypothetical protein